MRCQQLQIIGFAHQKKKAENWDIQIEAHLTAGAISFQELENLIGEMGFPQTNLFGKSARAQLHPLYRKFYARRYIAALSPAGRQLFSWRSKIIRELWPRFPKIFVRIPDFGIYTDAASLPDRIAGILMTRPNAEPASDLLCEGTVPRFWRLKFSRQNPIIGMEMLARLAHLYTAPHKFTDKRVNLPIDNDAASNTLIRGV